jgi:drug/metabolite transporter (DMT)-like permease
MRRDAVLKTRPTVSDKRRGRTDIWIRLMLAAFFANGIGPFGLKVLAMRGLSAYQSQYIFYWYLGGVVFAVAALVIGRTGVNGREILLGAAMGLCSFAGQSFTAVALLRGLPGHIVFPLTTGGSLLVVAVAGITFFKERIGPYGISGVLLGIASLVMLSIAG